MAAHAQSTTSERFCCRFCGADVVLAEELGGDLAYVCVSPRCGHACMVDAPEGLGIKPVAASWSSSAEPAGDDDSGEPAPHDPREERAQTKAAYQLALGVRLARARGAVLVPSGTTAGVVYRVEEGRCNCQAGQHGRPCWHAAAARQAA